MSEIVLPTALEFKADPRSQRRAYLACIVAYALVDYLKAAGETKVREAMQETGRNAFETVRSVANGSKHVETDAKHRIKFRVGDDYERPPAVAGFMEAGISRLGDKVGGRELRIADDVSRDIYASLANCLRAYRLAFANHFVGVDLDVLK